MRNSSCRLCTALLLPNKRLQRTAEFPKASSLAAVVARYAIAPRATIVRLPLAWRSGDRVSLTLTRPPAEPQTRWADATIEEFSMTTSNALPLWNVVAHIDRSSVESTAFNEAEVAAQRSFEC